MDTNEQEHWIRVFLVLELHEQLDDAPLGGLWVDQASLAELSLDDEESTGLLRDFLDGEASNEIHPLCAPWAQPGWFATAAAWMTKTLTSLGRTPTGPRRAVARLEELWKLAKPLAALHQAVSYLYILLGQEEVVHPEMASGLRDFVAHTVKAMEKI